MDEITATDETEQIAELEAQVEALERELASREADHQEIINRYEHVLTETRSLRRRRRTGGRTLRERVTGFVDRCQQVLAVSRAARDRRQKDDRGRSLRERLVRFLPWR